MYATEFVGLFTLSALVGMANVGGIGGGGITVPIVAICWGFTTKEAIALSGATIFWGSIVRFFWSIDKKHPEKKATHIDYGIVIVMLPLVIVGSATGVLVNLSMPPILLSTMLAALLLILTVQSTRSAVNLYRRETVTLQEAARFELLNTDDEKKLIPILAYDRAKLEKDHYIPDIRYIRDEQKYQKSDWTKEEDDDSDDEASNSRKSQPSKVDYNVPTEAKEEYNNSPEPDHGPATTTTALLRRHAQSAPSIGIKFSRSNTAPVLLKQSTTKKLLTFLSELELENLTKMLDAEDSHTK